MSNDVGYEKSDVVALKVFIPAAIFMAVVALMLFGLDQFFKIQNKKMYYERVLKPESAALKELHAKEHETLSNYKLIDKDQGVVQLPIDRAMELEVLENSK